MPIFQRVVEENRDLCPKVPATCQCVCPLGIRSSHARQLHYPWGYQRERNGKHPQCLRVTVKFVDKLHPRVLTDTRFDVSIRKTASMQRVVNILTSCRTNVTSVHSNDPSAFAETNTHLGDQCYKCPSPSSPSYLSILGQSCPLAGRPTDLLQGANNPR